MTRHIYDGEDACGAFSDATGFHVFMDGEDFTITSIHGTFLVVLRYNDDGTAKLVPHYMPDYF